MQKNVSNNGNNNDIAGASQGITVLELTVNNHPGVMSHICGLFSRRAYNLDGIVCVPIGSGKTSRMWLRVVEELKLEQVIKQIQKLPDVLNVEKHGAEHEVFTRLCEPSSCQPELI